MNGFKYLLLPVLVLISCQSKETPAEDPLPEDPESPVEEVGCEIVPTQFLTITSEGPATLSLDNFGDNAPILYHSSDKSVWWKWNYTALPVSADAPLYLCGENPDGISHSDIRYSNFVMTGSGPVRMEGSLMSLLDYDDAVTVIPCAWCFYSLFQGCEPLMKAPTLPATHLSDHCYQALFKGCILLNYLRCTATDIQAEGCVDDWMSGVSSTGTFIKMAGMKDWPSGASGIPEGWTVMDVMVTVLD